MLRTATTLRLSTSFARLALTAGLLTCGVSALRAQAPDGTAPLAQNVSLKQLMTPEEYKAAGLKKLSPEELNRLENFLRGYREQTVQQVAKDTQEKIDPAPKRNQSTHRDVVESHIKGPFNGATGRTRVLLDDGSIWQQVNSDENFSCRLDNPDVVLVRNPFGYKMYVTGAPRWFYVKQVLGQ